MHISLNSILYKILEKIIKTNFEMILKDHHIIPQHRYGFREEHATIEQVQHITNKIMQCLVVKKY